MSYLKEYSGIFYFCSSLSIIQNVIFMLFLCGDQTLLEKNCMSVFTILLSLL